MAIAYVRGITGVSSGSSTTVAGTLGATVNAGDMLCVSVGWASTVSTDTVSVTDDKSNVYTAVDKASQTTSGTNFSFATFYILNVTNGPITITATLSVARSFKTILIDEFSGVATSAAIDGHAINPQLAPGTGTNAVTSGNITTTANGDLIYGSVVDIQGAGAINSGTGFTAHLSIANAYRTEHLIQSSAGTTAATFTSPSNDACTSGVMAFKAVAAAATQPFGKIDWPAPRSVPWRSQPYDFGISLPIRSKVLTDQTNALIVQARQDDWPLPRAAYYQIERRGWISPITGIARSPFNQYDWPLPSIPNYPRDMRGWVETAQMVPVALPLNQYNWPLPVIANYPRDMRGWVGPITGTARAPFNQYDWPLPKIADYPRNMRGWVGRPIGVGVPVTVSPPVAQYDWPLPKTPDYPSSMRGWIDFDRFYVTAAIQLPFSQFSWPLPAQPNYPLNMRGWVGIRVPVVPSQPFVQYNWPPPQQAFYPVSLRGWVSQAIQAAVAAVQLPFNQYDWTLPRTAQYPTNMRGWIGRVVGIGTPIVVGQGFNQYNWPLPQTPNYPTDMRGWIDFDRFYVIAAVQAPISQYDWPLPRVAAQRSDRGWISTFNPGTLSFQMGFNTYDWPLPQPAYYPYFKSFVGNRVIFQPPAPPPITGEHHDMPFFATPGMLKSW